MEQLHASLDKGKISSHVTDERMLHLPEKAIQFGGGNFLRGYLNWMIHQMNKQGLFNGSVAIVQPNSVGGVMEKLKQQDALYTVVLRGKQNGEIVDDSEIISSVSRVLTAKQEWEEILKIAASPELSLIFSNTTEAGITYTSEEFPINGEVPDSFPGKLTVFLYERFQQIGRGNQSGLTIIPCELIDQNGKKLQEIVLRKAFDWKLSGEFISWLQRSNRFCNTLVDRIVTGYPKDSIAEYEQSLGYKDEALTVGEPYHMFVIDGDEEVKKSLPLHKADLNVKWGDITPYRELKVRLLNGPHTMMFSVGYLYGVDTVLEVMEEAALLSFIESGINEILPTVDMTEETKLAYVEEIKERFLNPFNKHYLTDIGLNAFFKFKSRLIPSLKKYVEINQKLPEAIVFSIAALLAYYRPEKNEDGRLFGQRNGQYYQLNENEDVLHSLENWWMKLDRQEITTDKLVEGILENELIWEEDLNKVEGLAEMATGYLEEILEEGMVQTVRQFIEIKQRNLV